MEVVGRVVEVVEVVGAANAAVEVVVRVLSPVAPFFLFTAAVWTATRPNARF